MKRIKFSGLSIFLILFSFSACNIVELEEPNALVDNDGNIVRKVTSSQIVATDSNSFVKLLADSTSKSWKTSLFTLAGSSMFTSCRLDDVMIFLSDGTYQYSAGSNLCGAEDNKASRIGGWEIDFSNMKIIFDRGTNNQYQADVIGLEEDELRIVGSYNGMEVRGLYTKN